MDVAFMAAHLLDSIASCAVVRRAICHKRGGRLPTMQAWPALKPAAAGKTSQQPGIIASRSGRLRHYMRQQRLNFFPLPQGQGSFRPTLRWAAANCCFRLRFLRTAWQLPANRR